MTYCQVCGNKNGLLRIYVLTFRQAGGTHLPGTGTEKGDLEMPGLTPHYVTETQTLRHVAKNPDCSWRFTKHALEEMANDG